MAMHQPYPPNNMDEDKSMNLSRRSLLTSLIAAPAVIAIDRLMPVRLWVPTIYGDAIHDDYEGLLAWMKGERVNILPRDFSRNEDVFNLGQGVTLSKGLYIPEKRWGKREFPERYYLPTGRRQR